MLPLTSWYIEPALKEKKVQQKYTSYDKIAVEAAVN